MLVAGNPGHCNLDVHQVEHSQDVAGNLYALRLAGSFQVTEDNQNPVGQLKHNVTYPQLFSITFFTCGYINSLEWKSGMNQELEEMSKGENIVKWIKEQRRKYVKWIKG